MSSAKEKNITITTEQLKSRTGEMFSLVNSGSEIIVSYRGKKCVKIISILSNTRAISTKKKLRGEKYLEDFYKKDISEIWADFDKGNIKLNAEEVNWGKPVGNEVW